VSWVRHATRAGEEHRSDATINLILAAIGSFYEYQGRLGVETAISSSRRFGAKSPYKPFLHHISRTHPLVLRLFGFMRSSVFLGCSHRSKFNLCWMRARG
jgi:hypothetical protein